MINAECLTVKHLYAVRSPAWRINVCWTMPPGTACAIGDCIESVGDSLSQINQIPISRKPINNPFTCPLQWLN